MTVLVILLAIAVGILSIIVFGLLRTHAEILRALDRAGVPLEGGATSPVTIGPGPARAAADTDVADITGVVPGGGPVKVALSGSHHTLLAFLSSGCRTCQHFWEVFRDTSLDLPGTDTRLVIVAQDPEHDSVSRLAELAPPGVRVVCSSATWQALEIPGSPFFALVDGTTRAVVGSGTATTWEQISGLLGQAVGDAAIAGGAAPPAGFASADEALGAAGIGPGHPTLYPDRSAGPGQPGSVTGSPGDPGQETAS
ncbi:MAG: hypothetical protein AAGE98_04565 [Actinomycetota bacterium]